MDIISLDAAEAMTGISRRTLWRRVADGALASGEKDARGRTTVALGGGVLTAIREHTGVDLGAEDLHALLQADAGDADAQADVGALLYTAAAAPAGHPGARAAALYWLRQAADQNHADAMHWLGTAAAALCTEQGNAEAMMWIAKAAAHSHAIAQQQLDALLGKALAPGAMDIDSAL